LASAPKQAAPLPEIPSKRRKQRLQVDRRGGADFRTISEAMEVCNPGDHIIVAPGEYEECILLEKEVHIYGNGERDRIIICPKEGPPVISTTEKGSITNLTLKKNDKGKYCAVLVDSGGVTIERCDITSDSLACLIIKGSSSNPKIINNHIHHSKQAGISIHSKAQALIQHNLIFNNTSNGIEVKSDARPIIQFNEISNSFFGIHFAAGRGRVEDNNIHTNTYHGINVTEGSNPTIIHNTVTANKDWGIVISNDCPATVEGNTVRSNLNGNIWTASDAAAIIATNRTE